MKYRDFIEEYFLIDEPKTSKLVPYIFNRVQNRYYDELVRDYDIQKKGLVTPIREIILKARREGFSSLILALFAADDILNENPTETLVLSYKDEATETFRRRYRNYCLSYGCKKAGVPYDNIKPDIMEQVAKAFFSVDSTDLVMKHNGAHFSCGTASSRTAGRGGVLNKLLFSEAAHYPDVEKITAKEIIDGTMREVDISSGWIFIESTANGYGNHYEKTWSSAVAGTSRFKPRFYGWQDFYTQEEFELIKSEFTDKAMIPQEYPISPNEAFIASGSSYFDNSVILDYMAKAVEPSRASISLGVDRIPQLSMGSGSLRVWEAPKPYTTYTMGGDVAQGLEGGDWSVLRVIDNRTMKTVAKWKDHVRPDEMSTVAYALGTLYNNAYIGVESNFDGLWVNTELFKMGYPNLYFREAIDDITNRVGRQVGFRTDEKTRPYILSELRKMLSQYKDIWNDKEFLEECLVFVRNRMGRPESMSGKNDDEIMSTAIVYEIRRNAPTSFEPDKVLPPDQQRIQDRLDARYGKKSTGISQRDFI